MWKYIDLWEFRDEIQGGINLYPVKGEGRLNISMRSGRENEIPEISDNIEHETEDILRDTLSCPSVLVQAYKKRQRRTEAFNP
jgi:hypothetical protein